MYVDIQFNITHIIRTKGVKTFKELGVESLAHGNRGKPSSNRISDDTKLHVLKLISEYYLNFGPTLVHEKLIEIHGFNISLETLRQWMIADGLWVPHSKRKPRVYRRDCLGELIQTDGSHHTASQLQCYAVTMALDVRNKDYF